MLEILHLKTIMDHLKGCIVLCGNTNDLAIGVILMQEKMMFAYESHKLHHVEFNYHVHEK